MNKFKGTFATRIFFNRKSMLLKILLSYIVAGSILIGAFSMILYSKFTDNSVEEINNTYLESLQQTYRLADTLWSTSYLYMYKEYKSNSWLITALNSVDMSANDWGQISKSLNDIVENNNLIKSIFVYNSKYKGVFSSIGPLTTLEDCYDPGLVPLIKKTSIGDDGYNIIYRKMLLTYSQPNQQRNVITVIFTDDNLQSAVIYNLDEKVFQGMLTSGDLNLSTKTLIINREGSIISHTDDSMLYKNIASQGYVQRITLNKGAKGNFTDYVDGKKSLVAYVKWSRLGWTFISVGDYEKLFSKVNGLQKSVFILTAVFIFFSILFSMIFAGNIYIPLFNLVMKVRSKNLGKASNGKNEIEYLKEVYEDMDYSLGNLKVYKHSSMVPLKKELLTKIINGEIAERKEIIKQITDLQLNLVSDSFIVCVIRFDNQSDVLVNLSKEDLALYRFAFCNITEELLEPSFTFETAESGDDHISIIININSNETDKIADIKKIFLEVQSAIREHLKFSTTIGIGSIEENLSGIESSYLNAMETTNYRLVSGKGSVILYSDVLKNSNPYNYPFDKEKKLIDLLKADEEKELVNALEDFINYIKAFSYDEIMIAISQLLLQVTRTVKNTLNIDGIRDSGIIVDYKVLNSFISKFETLEEIKKELRVYFEKVIDASKKKRENKYMYVVNTIQKYVDDNFHDPNLSVEMLSDLVDLSPNYIRSLFKENMNISITNYITELRYKKAQEFLLSTDYPANKIAEMIGLPANGYFYTSFKKACGMTPEEYRRLNKKE